jgi:hypothetical protein
VKPFARKPVLSTELVELPRHVGRGPCGECRRVWDTSDRPLWRRNVSMQDELGVYAQELDARYAIDEKIRRDFQSNQRRRAHEFACVSFQRHHSLPDALPPRMDCDSYVEQHNAIHIGTHSTERERYVRVDVPRMQLFQFSENEIRMLGVPHMLPHVPSRRATCSRPNGRSRATFSSSEKTSCPQREVLDAAADTSVVSTKQQRDTTGVTGRRDDHPFHYRHYSSRRLTARAVPTWQRPAPLSLREVRG